MDSNLLYLNDPQDTSWHSESLCRGSNVLLPEEIEALEEKYRRELTEEEMEIEQKRKLHLIFFPARGESATVAKAFCDRCPVEMECLEYSLVNGLKFGVWGGCPYRTRRRVLSIRRRVKVLRESGNEPDI